MSTHAPTTELSVDPAQVAATFRVGADFDLSAVDPRGVVIGPDDKDEANEESARLEDEVSTWQEMMYASAKFGAARAVLVCLQGMDTAGKGGTTKAIDRLLDPLGFSVVGFGVPSAEEAAQHWLWRHERALPDAGRVRVWDRTHYEAVLVERVRDLVAASVWQERYDEINDFEARLVGQGTVVVKIMLHLSPQEQAERFAERLADPTKHWKYNPGDIDERGYWNDYQQAYQEALVRCSTEVAPWYVVPADRKWYRNWVVSHLIAHTFRGMGLVYPAADFDVPAQLERVRALSQG